MKKIAPNWCRMIFWLSFPRFVYDKYTEMLNSKQKKDNCFPISMENGPHYTPGSLCPASWNRRTNNLLMMATLLNSLVIWPLTDLPNISTRKAVWWCLNIDEQSEIPHDLTYNTNKKSNKEWPLTSSIKLVKKESYQEWPLTSPITPTRWETRNGPWCTSLPHLPHQ